MREMKGFKLRKRLTLFSKWVCWTIRPQARYHRLSQVKPPSKPKPMSKLLNWSRQLTDRARYLRSRKPGSRYEPVGLDPAREKLGSVPKGHLAVYVGQEGDFYRVLVPVIYFKHRLFIELLREAEEEYGFQHQGGIKLPCGYSEFERIQSRIKACRRWRWSLGTSSCCGS